MKVRTVLHRTKRRFMLVALGFLSAAHPAIAAPLGMGFTFQGRLDKSGVPVTNTCDCQFSLFEDAAGITQVGATQAINGVSVVDGLFTVELNGAGGFGPNAFNGDERWLEIAVRCPLDASFTPLSPLQKLTTAPYALALPGVRTTPSGNAGFPGSWNVVGGSKDNIVATGVAGGTIGGGGSSFINQVLDSFGTVGGGLNNTASGLQSTVAGGASNEASATQSTVGGGALNFASGAAATIPGGRENVALGDYSLASGRRAHAVHEGTFVWGDATNADFISTAANQFLIRAEGGVGIGTAGPTEVLHLKRDFASVAVRFETARFQEGPPASTMHDPGNASASGAGLAWIDPPNALLVDGASSSVQLTDTIESQYLTLTAFGFALPADATIAGVEVTVNGGVICSCTDCDECGARYFIELVHGGTVSLERQILFKPSATVETVGSSNDRWGQNWTSSEINASGFGVRLKARLEFCSEAPLFGCVPFVDSGDGTALVDHVAIRVFFYAQSVTPTAVDWTLGVAEDDSALRISPDADLSSNTIVVTSTGNVGIGTAFPGFRLHVQGSAGKPGGGSWSNASDIRLKKNIRDIDGALDRLLALRGVTFKYKDPEAIHELPGNRIGMVAQEVEPIFPDWVEENESRFKTVTYRGFEALTVEALRDLRAEKDRQLAEKEVEIEALRKEQNVAIAELTARLKRLEEMITKLDLKEDLN